jgi:hypothetical protein
MRGGDGYATYAGRCLSLSALKDITMTAHSNQNHCGRSFDSWRHLHRLLDPDVIFNDEESKSPVSIFGLVLDIWYLIVWHICWGWCLIFLARDIRIISPLLVYSWGSLQAALWYRFEAFANIDEDTTLPLQAEEPSGFPVIPRVELNPEEMLNIVGKLMVARHGKDKYHLHVSPRILSNR